MLADAIQMLLDDPDVKAALVDWLRGNTPDNDPPDEWREVWRERHDAARAIMLTLPSPVQIVTNSPGLERSYTVDLQIIAYYCESREIASIEGFAMPRGLTAQAGLLSGILEPQPIAVRFYHYATAVHDYTEAIRLAQDSANLILEKLDAWNPQAGEL